ncbi:MAG TPA: hypothetical protein DIW43_06535, partial [Spongiibacteraceae bacterium]|nr:hypothetical protein [Spongiibacteraceae bacterium]
EGLLVVAGEAPLLLPDSPEQAVNNSVVSSNVEVAAICRVRMAVSLGSKWMMAARILYEYGETQNSPVQPGSRVCLCSVRFSGYIALMT